MAGTTGAAQGTSAAVARRAAVAAAGGAGLAAVLTACGGSSGNGAPPAAAPPAAQDPGTAAGAGGTGGGGAGAGQVLAKTSEIPEGGGKVFADRGVVVTRPAAGQFKAFSALCTHQGCAVKDIADGVINCPCHGSKFDAADGSVKAGPATSPLAPAPITVEGDSIRLA
ncbi:Rieske (2Fe-2S) protein [Streptomyces thermolilacinus]|uniref:Cytochrome bc1 complex Rieske iron-sulfur subunit n=1 Tax=Streptomyces thermolilacinus SPC6 TaxID=1306406 RepID=A0A1D3DXY8_9ACTN|nr:Rieske (2Fe-2S) protein [Streptomyces thermolilacinus]OEJ97190.1 Rieske (2Fe-2S) protein [Streptomyces thermolilacinus SPC6]